ncbi:MAG: hypothetical protein H7X95_01430, partial [Deltaproteobacteria bacterium]|nr:hypothetical protein [Deltaproteobacteria bacterium]
MFSRRVSGRSFWSRALFTGLLIGGAAIVPTQRAAAQEVAWTHTQIASVNGAMPSIEVDRLGYVHVGWTLGLGGSSYYAYHATNSSGDYAHTLVDSKTTGSP